MSRATVLTLGIIALLAGGAPAHADDGGAAGERKAFLTCPLVRNTFVPCWLAEHDGELYYLGPQGDLGAAFYPPQLGHKALVEGIVADAPRICGGIPLEPVNVSVMPELTPSCNTVLPAQGHDDPPHHRTPGPSNSEPHERAAAVMPAMPDTPPPEGVMFEVPFEFDVGERLYSRDSRIVAVAARYANEIGATRVEVIGYTAAVQLSSGEVMREREAVGELRARNVGRMLLHAGVDESALHVQWRDAERPGGADDFRLRRATIVVAP